MDLTAPRNRSGRTGSPPSRIPHPRALLAVLTALLIGLALSGCQSAAADPAEGKTLVLSLNQTEEHPSYVALDDFGTRLSERTDERWDVRVHPNETLGAQAEVIQLVSDGSVDMAVVSGTQLENLNPEFRTLNLPALFDDTDHQMRVINDEAIVGDLFASLEESNDLTVVGGLTQGERHLYTKTGPIQSPEDLRGQKIRVQESDVFIDMIGAMGGAATPMSYGEVYTALQSGVLDGAENNEVSYHTQKHFEVAPHLALTGHLVGLDYVVMNSETLEAMSPQDQQIFAEEWLATSELHTELWKAETEEATAAVVDAGVEINDVDEDAFREALVPVAEKYLVTEESQALYDAIREESEQ